MGLNRMSRKCHNCSLKMNRYICETNTLEKASDLLVYRDFNKCLEICIECLEKTRQSLEIERNAVLSEGICLVAIQAYAELNRWAEVLPFVTQLYNGIEDCPATIAQACVLLHAKLKDYATCTAVTNIWLRNKNNYAHPEYFVLVELFIGKILIPLDKWSEIPQFIDSCPGLTQELNEKYKKQVTSLERRKEQAELDKIHELNSDKETSSQNTPKSSSHGDKPDLLKDCSPPKTSSKSDGLAESSKFQCYAQTVAKWLKQSCPYIAWKTVKNVALAAVIVYLLLAKTNIDMLSKEGWASIWAVLMQLWRSMFSPYHLATPSKKTS